MDMYCMAVNNTGGNFYLAAFNLVICHLVK